MWARELGELAGVTIPLQAAEHYYLMTEAIEGVDGSWPVLEDPANYGYYREEGGGRCSACSSRSARRGR